MIQVTGCVATSHGGKYVTQLCKHWSHKLEVELNETNGIVRFPDAVATMQAYSQGIALSISGKDPEVLERLKGVIERHIDRFAFREAPLAYSWD